MRRYGGAREYNAVKNEWETTSTVDGKEIALRALGRLQTPELLSDFLGFISTKVAIQDIHTGT